MAVEVAVKVEVVEDKLSFLAYFIVIVMEIGIILVVSVSVSVFVMLSVKIASVCKILQSDGRLAGGYNAIGYSQAVWSTLIGRGISKLGSHWSRDVATPALLCHKEPAQGIQSPLLGAFAVFL